jgi:opacity protein-like surface antigen
MKKGFLLIGAAFFMIVFPFGYTWAEDFGFNVGLRTWYNYWEIAPETVSSNKSDYTFMMGPNFKVTYGKAFAGASFMATIQDYKLSETKWPRYDLDAMLGYMVHPRIGLIGGWKYIRGTENTGLSHKAYGPTFGFAFNHPIPIEALNLSFYLNGAFLALQGELTYPGSAKTHSYDIIGFSGEAGFIYTAIDNLSISLGYKYQNLDWRDLANDILSGVMLGINYAF